MRMFTSNTTTAWLNIKASSKEIEELMRKVYNIIPEFKVAQNNS